MKLKDLNAKHDSYLGKRDQGLFQKHSLDLYTKYQALYEGGELFHKNIQCFLNKNLLEGPDQYALRTREAYYESYINSIVNQFASQLFSSPFVIRTKSDDDGYYSPTVSSDLDSFYSQFKEDCDLSGTDLVSFMRDVFITALIKRCGWVLAEMPSVDLPIPDNLLDEQQAGIGRAYLSLLQPDCVFDWEVDEYNQLLWVITFQREMRREDPRVPRKIITDTWKIYDAQNVETFQLQYEVNKLPNKDIDVPSISKKPHGFTRVPFISLTLPKGLWLVNRLADAQIEHFRLDNSLSWAMRRACYPTAVYKTDDDDKGSLTRSPDGFAVKIGAKEELEWLSPPTNSFDVMMKMASSIKDEIYRLATQMALAVDNSAAAVGRSADSKAQDAQSTEICLHAYADLVKETVEEIFELISDARGDTDVVFSIEGMDEFNVLDVGEILANTKAAKELNLPSPTFQKEMQCKAAEALLFNVSQEIKDQIRQEIMSADIIPPTNPEPKAAENDEESDSEPEDLIEDPNKQQTALNAKH